MSKGCLFFSIFLLLIIGIGFAYWKGFIPIGIYDTVEYTNETHRYKIDRIKNLQFDEGKPELMVFKQEGKVAPIVSIVVMEGESKEEFTSFVGGTGAKQIENEKESLYPTFVLNDTTHDPKTKKEYNRTMMMVYVPHTQKGYWVTCADDPLSNFCNKIIESFEIY